MKDLLEVSFVIEMRAVGVVVAPQADGLAYLWEAAAHIGVPLGRAVAGFALDILQIAFRYRRNAVSGGVAGKAEKSFALPLSAKV